MLRLADLREILRYVPQYRDKTFVIALDGAIVEDGNFRNLLLDIHSIEPIRGFDEAYLSIRTPDVLSRIETGDPSWEDMVPAVVAQMIKKRNLLGCVVKTRVRRAIRPGNLGLIDSVHLAGVPKAA